MFYCQAHPDLCGLARPTRHCSEWKLIQCAPCARYESGIRRPHFGVPDVRDHEHRVLGDGNLGNSGHVGSPVPIRQKRVKRRRR